MLTTSDRRINVEFSEKDTTTKLIKAICKAFGFYDEPVSEEIRTLASSLIAASQAVEKFRSTKTLIHGKTDNDYVVDKPLYAYFVVNSVSAIGLFLLNFYKENFKNNSEPADSSNFPEDIPF